jgi:hypothetical protein
MNKKLELPATFPINKPVFIFWHGDFETGTLAVHPILLNGNIGDAKDLLCKEQSHALL